MAFDARGTVFGALTARHPGLIIRSWDGEEFRKDSRVLVEVKGAAIDIEAELAKTYRVKVETVDAGAKQWKGWIEFLQPSQLQTIPVLRALKQMRPLAKRGVMQCEKGGGTLRLDLDAEPANQLDLLSPFREALKGNKIVASIRIEEFKEPLETWNPKPIILP